MTLGHTASDYVFPSEHSMGSSVSLGTPLGLTKREFFAVFSTQPGVGEIATAAGYHSPDGFHIWIDEATKLSFNDWWSKLTNAERFALTSKVRVQQADALIEALSETHEVTSP